MKIAIGTASAYKVHAIKTALYSLDFDFESICDKSDSNVSEAPQKVGETKQGSVNRAKNILSKYPDCDLGLGVEFGYEPIEGKLHMVCWASIVTKSGDVFNEQSSTLELPKPFLEILNSNGDVSESLDQVFSKLHNNHTARQFIEFIKKRSVIQECTKNVMLRYLFDEQMYK